MRRFSNKYFQEMLELFDGYLPCGISINLTYNEGCRTICPYPKIRDCDTSTLDNPIEKCYEWCKTGCSMSEDPVKEWRR